MVCRIYLMFYHGMMSSMENEKTVWQIIFDVLKENGFDVYPPATHEGECKSPYIVLKQDGATQILNYSSETVYYRFLLYVPRNMYSYLSVFEKEVKDCINENLTPMIMPSGQTETDFYDDNLNAHLRVFLYRNNKRNKYL